MKKITFLSITLFAISISLTSCIKDIICIEGEGDIITKTLNIDEFDGINSMGAEKVIISQGPEQIVEVKGHENIIERLETEVYSGTWKIKLENEDCYTDYELSVYITVPDIREISITGSADIEVNDFVDQNELDLNITGSGDIEFADFKGCEYFSIDILGSGNIECNGFFDSLKKLEMNISGSGNFEGFNAETEDCKIDISGSGNCYVNVSDKLDIEISGSGDIYYKGYPSINTNITGSGDLVNAN